MVNDAYTLAFILGAYAAYGRVTTDLLLNMHHRYYDAQDYYTDIGYEMANDYCQGAFDAPCPV